jgi:hypothetical protein|tara:strand:- start:37 stop:210 length:174 start_codon:yes stop_codon:yes gene_type:complete
MSKCVTEIVSIPTADAVAVVLKNTLLAVSGAVVVVEAAKVKVSESELLTTEPLELLE